MASVKDRTRLATACPASHLFQKRSSALKRQSRAIKRVPSTGACGILLVDLVVAFGRLMEADR
jgi:hypothetical protein